MGPSPPSRSGSGAAGGQASIRERAAALAARVARRHGCELVRCEYVRHGGGGHLRVFLDKEGGITLDDCAAVSRELSAALDVEDLVPHSYRLEVSSPGLARPLVARRDFTRFAGRRVVVTTTAPVGGQCRYRGILRGLQGDRVEVEVAGRRVEIPLDLIGEARLDPEL